MFMPVVSEFFFFNFLIIYFKTASFKNGKYKERDEMLIKQYNVGTTQNDIASNTLTGVNRMSMLISKKFIY